MGQEKIDRAKLSSPLGAPSTLIIKRIYARRVISLDISESYYYTIRLYRYAGILDWWYPAAWRNVICPRAS